MATKAKRKRKQRLGKVQKAWLADLESRKYWQTNGQLRKGRHHCCLGVACRTIGLNSVVEDGFHVFGKEREAICAPREVIDALGLHSNSGRLRGAKLMNKPTLVEANDDAGATFKEIAAFCREHPEAVFIEPR